MKKAFIPLLLCAIFALPAAAETYWFHDLDSFDGWDIVGSNANVFDMAAVTSGAIEGNGFGFHDSSYAWEHATSNNADMSKPGVGDTRYLYFWGVVASGDPGRPHMGVSQADANFGGGGAYETFNHGFWHYADGAQIIAAHRDGLRPNRVQGVGKGLYDFRISWTGVAEGQWDVSWEYKDYATATWNVVDTLANDTLNDPGRIKLGSVVDRSFFDAVEYSNVDRTVKVPEPATLSLVTAISVMIFSVRKKRR